MLQVSIHNYYRVAVRVINSSHHCGFFAEISRQTQITRVGIFFFNLAQFFQSRVTAPVVHENIIKFAVGNFFNATLHFGIKKLNDFLLVVTRHNNCDFVHKKIFPPKFSAHFILTFFL